MSTVLQAASLLASHLVAPHASKDVIQLDVDGTEGQEACHQHLWHSGSVPWQLGNLTRVLVGAARSKELSPASTEQSALEELRTAAQLWAIAAVGVTGKGR